MRQAIIEKIEEETRRDLDPNEIDEAIRLMDEVRRPRDDFDGVEEIRKWRDRRK
jgi:hypothetical protein